MSEHGELRERIAWMIATSDEFIRNGLSTAECLPLADRMLAEAGALAPAGLTPADLETIGVAVQSAGFEEPNRQEVARLLIADLALCGFAVVRVAPAAEPAATALTGDERSERYIVLEKATLLRWRDIADTTATTLSAEIDRELWIAEPREDVAPAADAATGEPS